MRLGHSVSRKMWTTFHGFEAIKQLLASAVEEKIRKKIEKKPHFEAKSSQNYQYLNLNAQTPW